MKKKLSVLLCAAMVATSLAGCGGSSGAKTETTAAEASPAAVSAAAASAEAVSPAVAAAEEDRPFGRQKAPFLCCTRRNGASFCLFTLSGA